MIHRSDAGESISGKKEHQAAVRSRQLFGPDCFLSESEHQRILIHLLSEQDVAKQIQNLSHVMTELNIIHPFREGNGRSIRELIRCMGLKYGLRLNWGNTDRDTLINAAIASVDDDMLCLQNRP